MPRRGPPATRPYDPRPVSGAEQTPAEDVAGEGDVWLILPTYDEALNVERAVSEAGAALPNGHRILVVDDGSPDGTGAIADRLAAEDSRVEVLHRSVKEGLGPAYVAGFKRALGAGARVVCQMDADGSHDPSDLGRLIGEIDDGADLAIGSRYVDGGRIEDWGPGRRAISRLGCAYAAAWLRIGVRDLTGGFKAFRATTLAALPLDHLETHGYAFQVELTYRAALAGARIRELPIVFRDRRLGRSKMTTEIALEAAVSVPMLRRRVGRGSP
ncbi:polyprenol monophosphomannose synthase [Thermoleophilia bacterium SCSIO 60948]|nr:polyprenol monophosphomannose synthase [Thermoleophilia bacterium SCSIO 60948]